MNRSILCSERLLLAAAYISEGKITSPFGSCSQTSAPVLQKDKKSVSERQNDIKSIN